jgi:GNAT superfamily N-acetyltransferase
MISITPAQVTPALTELFDSSAPTEIRALAVLAGGNVGRIFTDDRTHPSWAMVWEADDGTLYPRGRFDRQSLAQVVSLLTQKALVALAFCEDDSVFEMFPPDPNAGAECLEFDRPNGSGDLSPYLGELPPGYELHRMDRKLLETSPKYEENLNRYGSLENFLARGIAVCILHGSEFVCEAYADMDIKGKREIGIRTYEAYRRKGFATTACAHLIALCEQAGSHTYWDCARLNVGSVLLARKLEFQNERTYKLLAWFPQKES